MTSYEITLVLLSALLHAAWNLSTKGSRSPLAYALMIAAVTGASVVVVLPFFDWRAIPASVWWILVASGIRLANVRVLLVHIIEPNKAYITI